MQINIHTLIPSLKIHAYIHTYTHIHIYRAENRRYRIVTCESLLGNCELLWRKDSPHFWALRITFGQLRISFQMDSQKDLFLVLTHFLDKIFPF